MGTSNAMSTVTIPTADDTTALQLSDVGAKFENVAVS